MRKLISVTVMMAFCLSAPISTSLAAEGTGAEHDHAHTAPQPKQEQIADQMTRMREMHEKMLAAKTPEERQELMAEHMKVMQDSMGIMKNMMSGDSSGKMDCMSAGTMKEHVSMMDMMMTMMKDVGGTPQKP